MGLFVNIPYYYNVSPGNTGTIYLRNSAAAGATYLSAIGSSFASTSSRPGFALDLEHKYMIGNGGNGSFNIDGITRSDWGVRWNQMQKFDDVTSSFFNVDYPQHHSLNGSSNISRQFKGFSLNLAATGSRDPGENGYSSSSETLSSYIQTTARPLGKSGLNESIDFTVQEGQLVQGIPNAPVQKTPISTLSADMRFFTAALHPDRVTNFTDSLSVGESLNTHTHSEGMNMTGTLGLTRAVSKTSNLNANYTFRYDPLLSQLGAQSAAQPNGVISPILYSATQQQMSLSYDASPGHSFRYSFLTSYGLPLQNLNVFGSASYQLNNDWGFSSSYAFDRYSSYNFADMEFTISRRFFGRYLLLSYSTQNKKLHFDLGASSF